MLPGSASGQARARTDLLHDVSGLAGAVLAKEELMTLEGEINEVLPDGRFGVTLDNGHQIIAYTAGKMRRYRIRSVAGDRVHVEMTPYDLTKGRITFRERTPGQGPGGPRKRGFRR
jgi:translation initiation factor IF-1